MQRNLCHSRNYKTLPQKFWGNSAINFTYKQYFLLHKTSIKLLFCKATYIIAEIQRVGNPQKFRGIPATLLRKKNLLGFWGPHLRSFFFIPTSIHHLSMSLQNGTSCDYFGMRLGCVASLYVTLSPSNLSLTLPIGCHVIGTPMYATHRITCAWV